MPFQYSTKTLDNPLSKAINSRFSVPQADASEPTSTSPGVERRPLRSPIRRDSRCLFPKELRSALQQPHHPYMTQLSAA